MKKLTIILALLLFGCDNYDNPIEVSIDKDNRYYKVIEIYTWRDECKYILQIMHPNTDQIDFTARLYFIADCNSYVVGDRLFFVPIEITE